MIVIKTLLTLSLVFFLMGVVQGEGEKCPGTLNVLVEKIEGRDIKEWVSFSAWVRPETAQVKSTIQGRINSIKVGIGQKVSAKGEIAEIGKDRLAKKNAEPIKYSLRCPIGGILQEILVREGQEVNEGDLVARINNPRHMLAVVPVSKTSRSLFSVGQKIPVTIENSESPVEGVVLKMAKYKILLSIANPEETIQRGDRIKFNLLKGEYQNAVVLHKSQVMNDPFGDYVYKVDVDRAKRTVIRTHAVDEENLLVTYGLYPGDLLIQYEVISPEQGTVRDEFHCLQDDKRVAVLKKDPETGLFQQIKIVKTPVMVADKRGSRTELVPEQVIKPSKPKIKKEFKQRKGFFRSAYVGGLIAFYNVNDNQYTEYYNNQDNWLGVSLGIETGLNLTLYADYKTYSDVGASKYYENGQEQMQTSSLQFDMQAVSMGLRYAPRRFGYFKPYVGVGVDYYIFSETVSGAPLLNAKNMESNTTGFDIHLGTSLTFVDVQFLEFNMGFKYTFIKKSFGNEVQTDVREMNLGGIETFMGLNLRI